MDHAESIAPVSQPLAQKKLSDFDKITSYGSVQVSGAQISNFFEIGSLEPENETKTYPKMDDFLPNFWLKLKSPILVKSTPALLLIRGNQPTTLS